MRTKLREGFITAKEKKLEREFQIGRVPSVAIARGQAADKAYTAEPCWHIIVRNQA